MSQKKKSSVSFGPGAASLILIFVVLALSVLSMLALMNGRNDLRLSQRSAQVVEAVYALNVRAEETRAGLDELLALQAESADSEEAYLEAVAQALPEGMTMTDRDIEWTESDGPRVLHCALRLLSAPEGPRTEWVRHSLTSSTAEEEDMFDW